MDYKIITSTFISECQAIAAIIKIADKVPYIFVTPQNLRRLGSRPSYALSHIALSSPGPLFSLIDVEPSSGPLFSLTEVESCGLFEPLTEGTPSIWFESLPFSFNLPAQQPRSPKQLRTTVITLRMNMSCKRENNVWDEPWSQDKSKFMWNVWIGYQTCVSYNLRYPCWNTATPDNKHTSKVSMTRICNLVKIVHFSSIPKLLLNAKWGEFFAYCIVHLFLRWWSSYLSCHNRSWILYIQSKGQKTRYASLKVFSVVHFFGPDDVPILHKKLYIKPCPCW